MSAAIYIGVIAQLTGWTEHHIRWHLPLSRGWAYFHTARLLSGEKRVWSAPTREDTAFEHRVAGFMRKVGNDTELSHGALAPLRSASGSSRLPTTPAK